MSPSNTDLAVTIKGCRKAAKKGFRIAKKNLIESGGAIIEASSSLSECIQSLNNGSVRTQGVVKQLKEQLSKVISDLNQFNRITENNLSERLNRLSRFSITLFGRTMAGKSTLMEILTHGNGQSIGKGAQRTTREVRSYLWNGLEVTDVPGVAAFEGAEDEEIAFKAAQQADIVLFLITDDAPQSSEVECFARVCRLGKPIIAICNVKCAIDGVDDLRLFLRSINKIFSPKRLSELEEQFHIFADRHIPGKHVPFIFSHLRSRFLADRPEFLKYRNKLLCASKFDVIESRIVKEVVGRGAFLRTKSFIDDAVVPMMDMTNCQLNFSTKNATNGRVLVGKCCQLQEWKKSFRADGQRQIEAFVAREMEGLREEVPRFAEDHYEDSNAGKKWEQLVEAKGITRHVHKLQHELVADCKQALSEVAREFKMELALIETFAADQSITMETIFNLKRYWNWGTTITAGGIGLAAVLLASGPLGWAAAAVGIGGSLISFLFENRESKANKAREKLSQQLYGNINLNFNLKRNG